MVTNITIFFKQNGIYDDLVKNPQIIAEYLSQKLSLKLGSKTNQIVKSISLRKKNRDKEIINNVIPELKSKIDDIEKFNQDFPRLYL
ncbi:MAG: hypothetical protein HN982_10170 [Candidatus Marinimicrobia bacterium]|jgi:hypothetical protein|nr:hypothetical protein [Candidatus Neomarinimicrobiota bacterium]